MIHSLSMKVLFSLIFLLSTTSVSWAGSISGQVTEPYDHSLAPQEVTIIPISGVTVELINTDTGTKISTTTDSAGYYTLDNIPANKYYEYTISFKHPNYLAADYRTYTYRLHRDKSISLYFNKSIGSENVILRKRPKEFIERISGYVTNTNGEGIQGIKVDICYGRNCGDYNEATFTNSKGYFTVQGSFSRQDNVFRQHGHIYLKYSDPDSNAFLYYRNAYNLSKATAFSFNYDSETIVDDVIFSTQSNKNISGTLTDGQGVPLEGWYAIAAIAETPFIYGTSSIYGGDFSQAEITKTDNTGYYSFSKLPPNDYAIVFSKKKKLKLYYDFDLNPYRNIDDGFFTAYRDQITGENAVIHLTSSNNVDSVDAHLKPNRLFGKVIDINNQPLKGVKVQVCPVNFSHDSGEWLWTCSEESFIPAEATTNSSGEFSLLNGTNFQNGKNFIVRFYDPNSNAFTYYKNSSLKSEATLIKFDNNNSVVTIDDTIFNYNTSAISGSVTDKDTGNPIENIIVKVALNGTEEVTTKTDSLGKYSITNLPKGNYQVSFSHKNVTKQGPYYFSDYKTNTQTVSIENDSNKQLDIKLNKEANRKIRGLVKDSKGRLLKGVIVEVFHSYIGFDLWNPEELFYNFTITDETGHFVLGNERKLWPVTYDIAVRKPDHGYDYIYYHSSWNGPDLLIDLKEKTEAFVNLPLIKTATGGGSSSGAIDQYILMLFSLLLVVLKGHPQFYQLIKRTPKILSAKNTH